MPPSNSFPQPTDSVSERSPEDIQFSTDADTPAAVVREDRGLAARLIGWGIAKNEQQARYIMIGAITAAVLCALWLWPRQHVAAPPSGGVPVPAGPAGASQ